MSYHFVYSKSKDDTKPLLFEHCPANAKLTVYQTQQRYWSRDERNEDSRDPWRAEHMSDLRNRLRHMFLSTQADVFLSLDTDVLLEDRSALETLVSQMLQHDLDVACALTYLHPLGEAVAAYNAGYFTDRAHGDFHQGWRRADQQDFGQEPPIPIDVPMAAYTLSRRAANNCPYKSHDCGEDIGFGQNLLRSGYKAGWCTSVVGRHVWAPRYL